MKTLTISSSEAESILNLEEGHFGDLKSRDVAPAKLTRSISALANADGGDLFLGIEDDPREWRGFDTLEDANAHVQVFEGLFPLGHGFFYSFLKCDGFPGYVLKIEVLKSHDVLRASDKKAYLRRGRRIYRRMTLPHSSA